MRPRNGTRKDNKKTQSTGQEAGKKVQAYSVFFFVHELRPFKQSLALLLLLLMLSKVLDPYLHFVSSLINIKDGL